jgi:diguanylate cyclase (GGDEF)-like protein/PAS domain S-box-containing protein
MVVEDDEVFRALMVRFLVALGYPSPLTAGDGPECLRVAAQKRPSLALMDIGLPGDMDGVEAARRLRAELGIPVIFITGAGDSATIERARSVQPLGYLVKPFDVVALHAAVETGLERAGLELLLVQRGVELEALNQKLRQRQEDLEKQNRSLRQAEKLIKESEERYRQIFETNQAIKLIVDPADGSIVDANQAACDFYGYPRPLLTTKKIIDINIAPREEVRQAMASAMRGERLAFYSQHRLASGEVREVEVHTGPMTWGGRTLLHSIIHDVSERRRAEEALKDSEERFKALFEQAAVGVAEIDSLSGRFLRVNRKHCQIMGHSREKLLASTFMEITHPDDLQADLEHMRLLREGRIEEFSLEKRQIRGDGSVVWINLTVAPLWKQGQPPSRHIAVVEDITARKLTEEALRRSEETLRSLVSANPESLLLVDHQGLVLALNQTAANRLGVDAERFIGQDVFGIIPPEIAQSRRRHMQQALASGQAVRFRDQRQGRHYDHCMCPIPHAQGQAGRLAIFAMDISEQVWAQERLAEARDHLESKVQERTEQLEAANHELQQEIAQRQAAQDALAASEKRWRRAVQWAPLPMMIHAEDGEVLLINDAWTELTGYTLADIPTIGRWVDLAYNPEMGWIKKAIKKIYHLDRRMDAGEFRVRAKDGRVLTWHFNGAPLGIGADGRRLAISIAMDVSERKQAEEKINSVARFPDENPHPVLRFTPEGALLYANKAATMLLELMWRDRDSQQDQPRSFRDAASWALATGVIQTAEVKAGDYIFSLSFVPVAGAGYVNIYGMDITQRKRAEESMRVLAKFPDENPNPVLRLSTQGIVNYANQACRQSLGAHNCQEGQPAPVILEPGLAHGPGSQDSREFEVEWEGRWYLFASTPVSETGEIYFYGRDVTERKQLEHQRQMASTVFDNSLEGIIIADPEGKVQMVNAAYSTITGFQPQDIIGTDLDVFRSEGNDPKFLQQIWASLAERGRWSGEYWNRRQNGEAYPEWLNVVLVKDSQGRMANYVVIFHDITDIKSQEEQIKHQAFHDALTGLPNRVLFKDRLGQAIAQADREGQRLAVLFLDLDNFKRVNDSLGHHAGDLLLQETARRLKRCLRETDTVSRLGGDEFTMILREVARPEDTLEAAGRILKALAEPFFIQGHELFVTTSMGITFFPDDAKDSDTLLKNADMAMYRAKDQGRNNLQLFTPALNAEIQHRLRLESQLRQGLEQEEFIVHYQPKVEVASGRVVGMEALVRWQRPGQGLLLPGAFINLAEETGLILPLGEIVLRQACRRTQAWRQAGHPHLCVSVNLSPRQFEQDNLVEMVEEILHQTGLPSIYLELEITEGAMMKSVDKAIAKLVGLASMGVRLSLDDFGTGYSSLSYLKRFSLSALKIDQTFVRDLTHDANDAAIVQTIIAMGHALELQVVAEGVETVEQLEFLGANGCDEYQGYYFSRPLPPDQFMALLEAGEAAGRG